jgi:hypothetical protein
MANALIFIGHQHSIYFYCTIKYNIKYLEKLCNSLVLHHIPVEEMVLDDPFYMNAVLDKTQLIGTELTLI